MCYSSYFLKPICRTILVTILNNVELIPQEKQLKIFFLKKRKTLQIVNFIYWICKSWLNTYWVETRGVQSFWTLRFNVTIYGVQAWVLHNWITKQKQKNTDVLSKFTILHLVTFIALLGHMHRLNMWEYAL